MTVTTKDHQKLTIPVLLKDAKPLEKYLLPDGRMIEVCASAKVLEQTGKLAVMKRANGNIHVYLLDKKGDRQENDRGEQLFVRDGLDPQLEVEPVARRGPKRRTDNLWWRGWGRKNPDKMDALIKIVVEEDFYVDWPENKFKKINHYARIGFQPKKFCAIFFNGELGLSEKPEGPLEVCQFSLKTNYGYLPHRIIFSDIVESGKWSEFEALFRRQLKEWKRSYVASQRGTP